MCLNDYNPTTYSGSIGMLREKYNCIQQLLNYEWGCKLEYANDVTV